MKCPNCEDVELSISERKNIEIDFCPKCRGVWLDKGELDKIIELSVQDVSVQAGKHHKDHREAEPYRKKKKESFLGELFDF